MTDAITATQFHAEQAALASDTSIHVACGEASAVTLFRSRGEGIFEAEVDRPMQIRVSSGDGQLTWAWHWARNRASIDANTGVGGVDMRTTVTLDDALLVKAEQMTGKGEKSALVRLGLEALIERESARRLALLGGSDRKATAAPRSRS